MNPVLIEELSDRIRTLAERGHWLPDRRTQLARPLRLAAHMLVMDRGQLIAQGTPTEVLADRRVQEAYIGGVA